MIHESFIIREGKYRIKNNRREPSTHLWIMLMRVAFKEIIIVSITRISILDGDLNINYVNNNLQRTVFDLNLALRI